MLCGRIFFPEMELRPYIDSFSKRLAEVEMALNDPKVFANNPRFQELSKEYARLKELVERGCGYLKTMADLDDNRAFLDDGFSRAVEDAGAHESLGIGCRGSRV